MKKQICRLLIPGIIAVFISCTDAEKPNTAEGPDKEATAVAKPETQATPATLPNSQLSISGDTVTVHPEANAMRNAYFGDLHVHTAYSFDAFAFGTLATPYDAYRYAKGEAIKHPAGFDVQLREPLDFYAVTDHAMFLGMMPV